MEKIGEIITSPLRVITYAQPFIKCAHKKYGIIESILIGRNCFNCTFILDNIFVGVFNPLWGISIWQGEGY